MWRISLGGQTDKMRPALPVRLAVFHQLQKSLVQQGGGLERMIMPLRPHVPVSDLAKLGFYHRKEPIGAALIARSPTLEKLGNRFRFGRLHSSFGECSASPVARKRRHNVQSYSGI